MTKGHEGIIQKVFRKYESNDAYTILPLVKQELITEIDNLKEVMADDLLNDNSYLTRYGVLDLIITRLIGENQK